MQVCIIHSFIYAKVYSLYILSIFDTLNIYDGIHMTNPFLSLEFVICPFITVEIHMTNSNSKFSLDNIRFILLLTPDEIICIFKPRVHRG
jgi:hypothetical protein